MSGERANLRGEYRAVRRALLDGPDFQALPKEARWVFVALKVDVGPSGVSVEYPAAIVATLAAQTGCGAEEVRVALNCLEARGWIKREANVIWIVGQLEHDPHFSALDGKHRKAVQRHIAGLPRLNIVHDFVAAHPAWFPVEEAPSMGLAWAFNGRREQKSKE